MFTLPKYFSFYALSILLFTGYSAAADLESAKRAYEQKDYATALKEFTRLAEQGNAEAQVGLARLYLMGQGVTPDRETAIKWFKAAAAQGNADAEFFVGSNYLLPQTDIAEGVRWLRLSAEQGNQDAQYLLGKAYVRGAKELAADPVQGAMWLRLAAKDNKKFYQDELDGTERQMTPEQVAKARQLAAEWKPKPARSADEKPRP
jgi:TPR repeat protein